VLVGIGALQLVVMVLLLARTKFLALALGAGAVGVLAVVDRLMAVFAQGAALSLPFAAIRYLPGRWTADQAAFGALYRRMCLILLGTGVGAALAGCAVAFFSPESFGPALAGRRTLLLLGFATVPALVFVPFAQNAMASRFEHRRSMRVPLANAAVLLLSALVGGWIAGLEGLYLSYAVAGTGMAIWAVTAVLRDVPVSSRSVPLPREIWVFALTMLAIAVLSPYGALYVQHRVFTIYGDVASGWMQAAIGLALAVRMLLGSAHAILLTPHVNRGGEPRERVAWTNEFQRMLCLGIVFLAPPLLLFPDLAMQVLYAKAFLPGAAFVALFLAAELLGLWVATYQALVLAFDHLRIHVVNNVVAQLLLVGSGAVLIPRLGIGAAALANLLAQVVLGALTIGFLRGRHGLRFSVEARLTSLLAVAVVIFSGIVGSVTSVTSPRDVVLRLVTYAVVLAVLSRMLTAAERTRIGHLLRIHRPVAPGSPES
jgi:O-antigen/teichoic acid export membrane protein